MASTCWASVRGEVMRVTKLDGCCSPQNDPCAIVVTDGFISAVVTQEIEAAQEIIVKNAADKICVYDPGCDSLKDLTVVLTLCKVNPELISIVTGQSVVLDYAGVAVGTRRSTDLACDRRFALEIWTQVPGTACAGNPPLKQWGYFLLPCVRAATITGDITIDGANAISVELTGKTSVPSLWGSGPENGTSPLANYDVVPIDAANTPGKLLTPISSTDHDHMQLTTIAPPVVPSGCGCVALDGQVLPNPAINGVTPAQWAVAGGTAATITGGGFTGVTGVQLVDVDGGPVNPPIVVPFVVTNDGLITIAASPAATAGKYELVVTGPGGKAGVNISVK
jgi:hypothetical protein